MRKHWLALKKDRHRVSLPFAAALGSQIHASDCSTQAVGGLGRVRLRHWAAPPGVATGFSLGLTNVENLLGGGGMQRNGIRQFSQGQPAPQRGNESLNDFGNGIADHMHPEDLLRSLVDY